MLLCLSKINGRAWTHKRASVSQVLGGSSGPDIAVAGVDPRRPSHIVVGKRAHDGGVAVGGQRNRATLSGGYLYLLGRFSIPMWSLPFQVERELHLFQPRQMKKFNYIT